MCELVQEALRIPAVTGMFEENAGADLYREKIYIIRTPEKITKMEESLMKMGELAVALKEDERSSGRMGHYIRGVSKEPDRRGNGCRKSHSDAPQTARRAIL